MNIPLTFQTLNILLSALETQCYRGLRLLTRERGLFWRKYWGRPYQNAEDKQKTGSDPSLFFI